VIGLSFSTPLHVDHEAQWLFLAKTLSPREDVFDPCALFNVLSASAFPRHQRTGLAREISLCEDVIRNVREALTALHVCRVETDALRRGAMMMRMRMRRAVHVFVVHPNGGRGVRYDETKRGRGGVSNAASEQILDGVARLETRGSAFLPPGDGAPLRVHESLLEDVIEDILEIKHVGDVNELCGHSPLRTRRLVVGDPEIRR